MSFRVEFKDVYVEVVSALKVILYESYEMMCIIVIGFRVAL